MKRTLTVIALMTLCLMTASAVSIPINNPSFESPSAPGTSHQYGTTVVTNNWYRVSQYWDVYGSGAAGARVTIAGLTPTDGSNMGAVGRNAALFSIVDLPDVPTFNNSLAVGTYTLTYDVGHRNDQPIMNNGYSVEIWGVDSSNATVGTSALASIMATAPGTAASNGQSNGTTAWSTRTISFDVFNAVSGITGLQIRLVNRMGGTGPASTVVGGWNAYQVNFDKLSLEFTSAVPEPGTWALMGTVGAALALMARRRRAQRNS